jgi:di/tricarboxylate transporter
MDLVKAKVCFHISGSLPFGANWMVLFASFFLIIVIIVTSCGGIIRLPFYMGGLELSGQRPQERITAGPQVL